MELAEVSDADFQQRVLQSPKPVLVDFWASWCQPCLMMAPIVDQVASENQDVLTVTKLNIDTNQQTVATYGIQSIPTLVLFKDGKEVKRLVGYMPKDRVTGEVKRVIGVPAAS